MTPSRPTNGRLAVVVGLCVAGLILAPIYATPAVASPSLSQRLGAPTPVSLRLDGATAARVLAEEGAVQEADPEKPRSMDEQATTGPRIPTVRVKKAEPPPPPPDHFKFLKDWPFWVIVGGVIVAGTVGLVALHNSNKTSPCGVQFTAGCFGSR